ncbi:30S ribosomal protein S1 [candidate division KSB1 bacterium]|nr:30S ribosomal protein S1 [candidate division KSB1 bacterium]
MQPSDTQSLKVVKLTELAEEKEYTDDEYKQLVEMYDNTLNDFVEGELVTGKILGINNKEVAVDIGFKSEGTIPIDEFGDPGTLNIGDDIEVFLDEVEDKEGQLVLSKKKADFMRIWDKICNSYENGDILQGKCTRRIKGGIVVDLMGIDAFLPGSQIDVKPIRDFDAFIGQSLDLKVVKINNLRKNIVVSRRILVEAEIAGQRQKILDELVKEQVLEGTVKNITDFGVFIDLGGVDGLLHINDLSWGRVSHPSEVVALDEKIKVMVLDFNEDKDRISLGLKQLQPHPWENVEEKYPVNAVVRGKVVSISDYGAFVELEKGVEGLIHISEMSWTQHIKHPSKIVTIGETVEAKILNIEKEERKISLGLKQLEPDPWETLEERYPIGSRHEGKVRNLTNFGAFIELEDGIDGLVHISDLSWTKKIRHPSEVLKKGAKVDVVVLNVDRANRRISLGYKQTAVSPWDTFEETYKPGALSSGKIVRLIEKGIIVELPDEVDGFVPISHLAKQVNKPSDGYQVDDTLELRVIEFNKENKKIVLSERLAKEASGDEITSRTKEEKPAKAAGAASEAIKEPAEKAETVAEPATEQPEVEDEAPEKVEPPVEAVAEAPVAAKAEKEAPAAEIAEETAETEKSKEKTEKADAEPAKKTRTRKKKAADEEAPSAEAVSTDDSTDEEVKTEEQPEPEEKPKKRTRKTKKSDASEAKDSKPSESAETKTTDEDEEVAEKSSDEPEKES